MGELDIRIAATTGAPAARRVATGRSGQSYTMILQSRSATVEGEDTLYALATGAAWGWVGSARDLIEDPESRARFRALSRAGAALYRFGTVADPLERMTIVWDIESGSIQRHQAA